MQVAGNDLSVWKEAINRCLLSLEDYEIYSKDIMKYFVDDDPERIELFLKELELPLRSKRYGVVNKLSCLMLLRDKSEKKSKKFAEALALNRVIYLSVYQIAIAEPFIKSPVLEKRKIPALEKKTSENNTNESNWNNCIRLAIECILYWRLNFGLLPNHTGRLFCALHFKALHSQVVFPEIFTFFSEKSQRAIKELKKALKKAGDESFADISMTEESFITAKSEDDLEAKRTQSSLDLDRRLSIDRKAGLAQLEAELVGLRQFKIEEGKAYSQEGLTEKPSDMRDKLMIFFIEMKQKLGSIRQKASIFDTNNPSKDEKQVLGELKKEEDELKETEDYVQENFMNFENAETISKILNYLCIRPGSDSTVKTELSLSIAGILNNIKDTSLDGNQISIQLPVEDTGNFVSPSKFESGSSMPLLVPLGKHKNNDSFDLSSPLAESNSKRQFTFGRHKKQGISMYVSLKAKVEEDKAIAIKDDPENYSTPVFKLTSRHGLDSRHTNTNPIKSRNPNDLPLDNENNPIILDQFSSRILEDFESETREKEVQSLSNKTPGRISSVSKTLRPELAKDLENIAKSIEISQKRSRLTKGSPSSRVSFVSARSGILHRHSNSMNDSNLRPRSPIYTAHLNLEKEIRDLKVTSMTLLQENTLLKRELTQIKSTLSSRKKSSQSILIGDSIRNELLSPSSAINLTKTFKFEDFRQNEDEPSRHLRFNSYDSNPLNKNVSPEFVDSQPSIKTSVGAPPQRQRFSSYSNSTSWNSDVSLKKASRYDPSWTNTNNSAPKNLSKKLVVKELVTDMSFYGSAKSEVKTTRMSQFEIERQTITEKSLGFIFPDRNSITKCETIDSKTKSTKEMQSPALRATPSSRLKPIMDLSKKGSKSSRKTNPDHSLKVGEHTLFRNLANRLDTSSSLRMFKLASLCLEGQIFENDTLDISVNTIRVEDLPGKRRLVRVNLTFENKSDMHIQNLSIIIHATSALSLVRDPDLSKTYIKPKKKREVEFVIGIAETIFFSHLEIDCGYEQVNLNKEGNPLLKAQLLVPITYFNFMEGIRELEDNDISLAWSSRSDHAFYSSAKLKINQEIVKNTADLVGIFRRAKSMQNSRIDSSEENEPKTCYFIVYETERLGEFVHLRLDWFPDSHEMILQIASPPDNEQKGIFLIQTLIFLLS